MCWKKKERKNWRVSEKERKGERKGEREQEIVGERISHTVLLMCFHLHGEVPHVLTRTAEEVE